jgi:GT2 family glycosyltransferase
MEQFSVVIIVKNRRKQLDNVLQSIQQSTIIPHDIQIVCMDDPSDIKTEGYGNVKLHTLESSENLPLAAARNRGVQAAETDRIICIDVDCIVSPTLFTGMLEALTPTTIIVAYPRYLSIVPRNGNYADLYFQAVDHPARKHIVSGEPVPHLEFWSLIFAIHKNSFQTIGGFDESFTGYGAEDTDFAMTFHKAGMQQIFVKDFVLHQYHDKYDPPLNHFNDILQNAATYYKKWGSLPMGRWLRLFAEASLITINDDNSITILRQPTETEIQASRSTNPY